MVSLDQDTHPSRCVGGTPAPRHYMSMTLRCPTLFKCVCPGVSTQDRELHKWVRECRLGSLHAGRLADWNILALLAESPACIAGVQHVVARVW
jgi:hypothetical protein